MISPSTPPRRSGGRAEGAVLSVFLLLAIASPAAADPGAEDRGPAVGGSIAWFTADELDLIAEMRADLPLALSARDDLFFALDARTVIERAGSNFAFLVRSLDYRAAVGYRRASRRGPLLTAAAGQLGSERVDRSGQPFVRFVGFGLESRNLRRQAPGLQWSILAGPTFYEREVSADGVLRARGRYALSGGFGFEAEVDGLVDDGSVHADVAAGPFFRVPAGNGRGLTLFAHYRQSENPIGLRFDGWTVGLDYRDVESGYGTPVEPPRVAGSLTVGAGPDERIATRFLVELLSPEFAGDWNAVLEVEGNILTASDTGELYYFYHTGIERFAKRLRYGAYFYHRSNHTLAEPNSVVTFYNVAEIGMESPGWGRPGHGSGRGWSMPPGRFEGRVRLGYLLDSSFGKDVRWHLRGGARFNFDRFLSRFIPFLLAEFDAGDVDRRLLAAGMTLGPLAEARLAYRRDDQFFGADQDAWLLDFGIGF